MATRSPLENQLRTAARAGLYVSLALTTGLFLLSRPWIGRALDLGLDTSWFDFDFEAERSVQHLQALLQIDTTEQTGREIDAARYLESVVEAAGIPARVEELVEGRANFWAILEGQSPEALVLHSHIDTDPIRRPQDWEKDPFSGEIEKPWIYGRGAFDMKSVTSAQLESFLRIKEWMDRTGSRPERSLILLATSSEETGSHLGAQHILHRYPELVSRFWGLLTEGGVVELIDRETIKYWGTSFAQKRFVQVWACSPSEQRLRDFYDDLVWREHLLTDLALSEEVLTFLESYAPTREEVSIRRILSDPESALWNLEDFVFLPDYMKALYRSEVHAFPIEEDPDSSGYRMQLMLHLRSDAVFEEVLPELLPEWMVHGIALTFDGPLGSADASPLDHPVFQTVQEALQREHGPAPMGPFFLSFYANDSRFFRTAGVPSYGFSPFIALSTDAATINGPDERIALPAFVSGVELYQRVVFEILGVEPAK